MEYAVLVIVVFGFAGILAYLFKAIVLVGAKLDKLTDIVSAQKSSPARRRSRVRRPGAGRPRKKIENK